MLFCVFCFSCVLIRTSVISIEPDIENEATTGGTVHGLLISFYLPRNAIESGKESL
jgi:hypothetical protein